MVVIETEGLTKYYGDVRGIEDLSIAVEEGEVFGFLGPNGAGKTTTIRTLMGFLSPTAGSATVLGAPVTDAEALREARSRVGFLPAEPGFEETMTGRRLLRYHGSLRGDERSEELLELFDPPLDRKVGQYSRGNKQKLAVVIAFMNDPDLLIMDEPTSGLDPLLQERLLEFIRAERERGTTFFFSSHILSEVRKVCDRVGIIRDGHLVELEDVETLLDRSGKLVRVRVAGDVDPAALAIDGAHDVEVRSETGGGRAAERRERDELDSRGERNARGERDELEQRRERNARGEGGEWSESGEGRERDGESTAATTVAFTYTGPYEPLLETLLTYDVLDLSIEEAPLEDVFMRFYGEREPAEAVDA